MRTFRFAANTSSSSFSKQFHRVLLLSALFATASLNSWAQNITVSPASLTFAKQLIDTTSASKAVTITNSGASAQPIVIAMSGDFTETDNCGGSVAGSGSCTAKVTFAPTLVGSIKGAASIYDNSKNLLAFVGLTGTGGAPVTTAPASLSFTGGTIGTKSAAKTFKITNNTTGTVTINSITTNVTDYTITTGTCLTTPLAKAGSCTVTVTVTPTSAADNGAIIITDNAPNAVPQVVKLTSAATGGTTPPISLSKTSLTFKTLSGTTSATQTITVTNTSASAVTLGTITASADYAIPSTTCTSSLPAAGTCAFGITFNPTFIGAIGGSVAVPFTPSNSNSPQVANLTGTSLANLTVAPASLTFAAQAVGTASTAKAVKITNNSTSAVTLSSVVPTGDFKIQLSGTTCPLTGGTLTAGKYCTIEIQFAPTIAGSIVGALTVTNTASPNPLLVPLTGTGTTTYTIGGTVSGLSGTGLVLQNNGGNNLPISANGSFTFTTPVASGSTYNVTVLTQPSNPAQTCVVTNGSGTANANVTNVQVACTTVTYTIGGTVSGLSGTGLVLQNNGGNNLAISANGSFTFTTPVASGSTYNVTVLTQPSNPAQTCVVTNGSGTANANVTNVQVACTTPTVSCTAAPTGHESMLNGQYAFVVQGVAGSGAYPGAVAIAASFSADGAGNVGGGDFDINITNQFTGAHATINASSYTVGLDPTSSGNLGCVLLSLSNGTTTAFRFSLGGLSSGVFSKGRIIEFDDASGAGLRGSGVLLRQDPTSFSRSHLQPRYALGVDGFDTVGHFAGAGSFNVNTGGNISNGWANYGDTIALETPLSGGTGQINAISTTTGRATMTTSFWNSLYGGAASNWAIYMVNADEFFMIETDSSIPIDPWTVGSPICSGRAIVTASSYTQSSLSGNYIIHMTSASSHVSLGLVNLNSGALSGTIYYYDVNNGGSSTPIPSGATYAVDATTGQTTISGAGSDAPVIYIATPMAATEPISAFMGPMDYYAGFGFGEFQPNQTYSTSGMAGDYFVGTEDPGDNTVSNEIDVVNISSGGTVTGSGDKSGPSGLATESVSGTVDITSSNGVGNMGTNTVAITNGTKIFFIPQDPKGTSNPSPAKTTVYERQ